MKNFSEIQLREALSNNLNLLLIFGYWQPENAGTYKKFFYTIYGTLFIGFFLITYTISEITNIIMSMDDLEKLTAASFLFLTHMAQVFKLYFFTTNNTRIKKLINSLNREVFKPKSRYQHDVITKCIVETKIVFNVFAVMCILTCGLWGVFPVIDRGDGDDDQLALPLSAYYPFRTDTTPIFQIIFAYQIIATTINALSNISMDTLASGLMSLMGAQLDMLNDTFINMRRFAEESLEEEDRAQKNEFDLLDDEMQAEMDRLLVHCVDHHRNILEVTNEVGVLFNISVLCQFVSSAIIICLTMFELTLTPLMSIKFVSMVMYQACMLVEIIVYCWYGNEVILKSSTLGQSAYFADWTSCKLSFKKNLLFIMTRTRDPIKLYAGVFFTLSLETFVTILRTSWSYFAVLNRKHQE